MIIIFMAITLLLVSYSLFTFSFAVHGINRLVVNAPKAIFEYAVVINEIEEPFFDQTEIEKRYISYIDDHIYQYVNSYEIKFRFYDPSTSGICEEKCEGVEVKIASNIAFSYVYSRVMFYEISEVQHG